MTTEIRFYHLQTQNIPQALPAILAKALAGNRRIVVKGTNEKQIEKLNEHLWTYQPDSFLPHGLVGSEDAGRVGIGWGQDPQAHDDLLINLDLLVPPFFSRFHRVAEVVTQDPQSLEALRASWSFYRERGFALEKHDIRGV